MLTKLGATPAEDRVYRFLVTAVSAPECEIADATGLSEDDVREALESLIRRGLVEPMPDSPSRFVAASPGVVESMISERLSELRTAQQTLDGLASHYRVLALRARGVGARRTGLDDSGPQELPGQQHPPTKRRQRWRTYQPVAWGCVAFPRHWRTSAKAPSGGLG